MTAPLHAVALAVAVDADGPLAGALILGEAGAGKSSLALAAIGDCPFRRTALVADDQVLIDDALVARAPDRLQGLIEIRGLGPSPVRSVRSVRLIAALKLGDAERAPEPRFVSRSELEEISGDAHAASARLPLAGRPKPRSGFGWGSDRPSPANELPLYPFRWTGAEATAAHRLRALIRSVLSGQNP